MTAPQSSPSSVPAKSVKIGSSGVEVRDLEDLQRMSNLIVASGYAPKGDTPQGVAVKIQLGLELGLPPMFALSNIKVLNGRPSIFGDAGKAILMASGMLDGAPEIKVLGKPDDFEVIVKMRRKGMAGEFVGTFSTQDAKRAKLWGKTGPWTDYLIRQATWRAWWFAAREGFADVFGGIGGAEEVDDIPREASFEVKAPQARPRTLEGLLETMPEVQSAAAPMPEPEVQPDPEPSPEPPQDAADDSVPPIWAYDAETILDTAFEVRCDVFSSWCDQPVPKGKLSERAPTWRDTVKGGKGGGRHALLLDIVNKAQKLPLDQRVKAHEYAACCLAIINNKIGVPEAGRVASIGEELPWG